MTRLEQLLQLRERLDEEITVERARHRHQLPADLAIEPLLLIDAVCTTYAITYVDLIGTSRTAPLPEARAVAAWLAHDRELTPRVTEELLEATPLVLAKRTGRVRNREPLLQRAIAIRDYITGREAAA